MALFSIPNWPLLVICLGMIACAVIDWWKFKVPNYLTFPLILSGWVLGLCHTCGWQPLGEAGAGGIGASLAGTFFGFALLFPILAIGGMGEGDVKMTMGFGSWMGAFFGFGDGLLCLWVIFYAFAIGVIIGGVLSLIMMAVQGEYRRYFDHTRVILLDLLTLGRISKIYERAHERRPRWYRLPYGIPLCLGFVGFLVVMGMKAANPPAAEERAGSLSAPAVYVAASKGVGE